MHVSGTFFVQPLKITHGAMHNGGILCAGRMLGENLGERGFAECSLGLLMPENCRSHTDREQACH